MTPDLPLAGAPQGWESEREEGGGMSCLVPPTCSPLLADGMLTDVGGGGGGIMPGALLIVGTPNLKENEFTVIVTLSLSVVGVLFNLFNLTS